MCLLCRSQLVCLSAYFTLRPGPGLHIDSGSGALCSGSAACRRRGRQLRGRSASVSAGSWEPQRCGVPAGGGAVAGPGARVLPEPARTLLLRQVRAAPSAGYHGCSLDPAPLPRWVRTPRRPSPWRRAGGGWSRPRAVLSSQVRGCCCRSPRAAREPVSGGVRAGKRVGPAARGAAAGRCERAQAQPPDRGSRGSRSPAGGWLPSAPCPHLGPVYSGLPILPRGGIPPVRGGRSFQATEKEVP